MVLSQSALVLLVIHLFINYRTSIFQYKARKQALESRLLRIKSQGFCFIIIINIYELREHSQDTWPPCDSVSSL